MKEGKYFSSDQSGSNWSEGTDRHTDTSGDEYSVMEQKWESDADDLGEACADQSRERLVTDDIDSYDIETDTSSSDYDANTLDAESYDMKLTDCGETKRQPQARLQESDADTPASSYRCSVPHCAKTHLGYLYRSRETLKRHERCHKGYIYHNLVDNVVKNAAYATLKQFQIMESCPWDEDK